MLNIDGQDIRELVSALREWLRVLVVPKTRKGCLGIVIALNTESAKEKQRLKAELAREMALHLSNCSRASVFQIIQYNDKLAACVTDRSLAEEYARRSRAKLIIYGDLVQRKIRGETNFVLRLHCLVLHRPVPMELSSQFGAEFGRIFPSKVAFAEADELFGFEITRQWIEDAARYIVGVAALLSGDVDIAHKLLVELEDALDRRQADTSPVIPILRERVNARLADVLECRLAIAYQLFMESQNRQYLIDCESFVESLLKRVPEHRPTMLFRSMILFSKGEVGGAIELLKSVRCSDALWRYNLGFLYAYDGQIDKALDQYRRAAYGVTPSNALNDLEIFLGATMKSEPEKKYLLFFRGLLNLKSKADYILAKNDFKEFLEWGAAQRYPQLQELAKKYLQSSESHLGI